MADVQTRDGSEPRLRIPQPRHWEHNTKLDSAPFRFALVNTRLTANRFAPTVVVTLEEASNSDPQTIFARSRVIL